MQLIIERALMMSRLVITFYYHRTRQQSSLLFVKLSVLLFIHFFSENSVTVPLAGTWKCHGKARANLPS